ncbi:MAG TPA: sigma-54 dependent transcriptional regulator [Gammaproteobacteria bacterium]|nr:sigma-54 dependent transcriptional regulator [Gammaproteobacteria bacterium]
MSGHNTTLLGLWQEVGRHGELSASIGNLAAILAQEIPLVALILFELDETQRSVLPLAEWRKRGGGEPHHHTRLRWDDGAYRALKQWCANDVVEEFSRSAPWPIALAPLESFAVGSSALVAPLRQGEQAGGLVMIVAGGAKDFAAGTSNRLRSTLDPFSAAVANELRLRELARLRAAAEADRTALLSRLGRDSLDEVIIGATTGLQGVMHRVELVAKSDTAVLLLGETGAGKEVIARTIHDGSARHGGPFLRVNCGAIPPELMDSELFGHERGSFTGAIATRRGWFERADGGTLLLDEVAELPPAAQVRLLRVLQEGRIHRVGGERELAVDVRIIAATHRNLAGRVQEGSFREDLWYRLAVFPIILPPLRERQQDIPDLVEHFVRRAAGRLGIPVPPVTAEDIAQLQAYRWPGNIRELAAVLERAVILGEGRQLATTSAMGVVPIAPHRDQVFAGPAPQPGNARESLDSGTSFDSVMRQHLELVLRQTHGKVEGRGGASGILKLNANTLRAKLRRLGIRPADFRTG